MDSTVEFAGRSREIARRLSPNGGSRRRRGLHETRRERCAPKGEVVASGPAGTGLKSAKPRSGWSRERTHSERTIYYGFVRVAGSDLRCSWPHAISDGDDEASGHRSSGLAASERMIPNMR